MRPMSATLSLATCSTKCCVAGMHGQRPHHGCHLLCPHQMTMGRAWLSSPLASPLLACSLSPSPSLSAARRAERRHGSCCSRIVGHSRVSQTASRPSPAPPLPRARSTEVDLSRFGRCCSPPPDRAAGSRWRARPARCRPLPAGLRPPSGARWPLAAASPLCPARGQSQPPESAGARKLDAFLWSLRLKEEERTTQDNRKNVRGLSANTTLT